MKILGLTNLYPSPWFPLRGVFNKQLFDALAKTDDVRLIVPISWTDELKTFGKKICGLDAGRRSNLYGIYAEHPRYLFPPKLFRSSYGHWFLKSIEGAFRRALDEFQPDVLLAAWAYPDGWAAVELGHRHGLPVVVKLHGSDALLLSKIRGCRERIAQCLSRADGLIAVSRDLAANAIALGADASRVTTVYDGVDRALFHPGDRTDARRQLIDVVVDDPIILFIGNLVAVKGIDVLLDACHRLARQGTRFHCYLVGQGLLHSALSARIQQLNLSDRVSLVGPRPHAELPNWYRAANVFVLPSRSEGVPCVLLEAAACGTPCVASAVGGIPEIAGWGAMTLTPPDDAAALAEAIAATLRGEGAVADRPVFTRTFEDAAGEVRAMLGAVGRPKVETPVVPVSNTAPVTVLAR